MHRSTISRVERGHAGTLSVDTLASICAALDVRLDLIPRWRGGDLDRLLNAGHSALHEAVASFFAQLTGWTLVPEATFAIFGERGAIDILCWHAATRSLLVIELKTEIVDVQELIGSMDRKLRLAWRVARERGWQPTTISGWVIVTETTTNRRRLASHQRMLRNAFPADGMSMRAWVRQPAGRLVGLSLWSSAHPQHVRKPTSTLKRVRKPTASKNEREPLPTRPLCVPEQRGTPPKVPPMRD